MKKPNTLERDSGMPRRAYSYLRISSRGKQERGDGLRRQDKFAESLCSEYGWCLDDTMRLVDVRSGFHGDNKTSGNLGIFLEAIREHTVLPGSVLIVECIDRLSREEVDEAYDLFRSIIKAGVWIATQEPKRIYNKENCNGIVSLLEPLFIMSRAHEESKIKSMRQTANMARKRELARGEGVPFCKTCPAWMTVVDGQYRLIPEHVRTVQKIYSLAAEGYGAVRIKRYLQANSEEHPAFPRSGGWNRQYIRRLVRGRVALGEYQPRTGNGNRGGMKADGEPITNYFPAIVTEEQWRVAQAAMDARTGCTGRPGIEGRDTNLVTGLVWHAETRSKMCIHTVKHPTRHYRYLVPVEKGIACAAGWGCPYESFEECLLGAIEELEASDLVAPTKDASDLQASIRQVTSRLVALKHREAELQQQLANPDTEAAGIASLTTVLLQVVAHREAAAKDLAALKFKASTSKPEVIGEVQTLIGLLRDAGSEEEVARIRHRIKTALLWILDSVWVRIQPINRNHRVVHVQLYLKSGKRKYVQLLPTKRPRVPAPPGPGELNVWDLCDCDFRAGQVGDVADDASASQPSNE